MQREESDLEKLSSSFDILRKTFPDYEDRPEQREMADEIFCCFRDKKSLLVEAGTGVNKSFAYELHGDFFVFLRHGIHHNNRPVHSSNTDKQRKQCHSDDTKFEVNTKRDASGIANNRKT